MELINPNIFGSRPQQGIRCLLFSLEQIPARGDDDYYSGGPIYQQ